MLSFPIDEFSARKLNKIIELSSLQHERLNGCNPACREALQRYAKISNIGASTRIENALLTDTEIDWMDTVLSQDHRPESLTQYKRAIEDKLSKDKERSIEEVAGLRDVLNTIYAEAPHFFPLSAVTIRQLHHELLKYYPKAAPYWGRYKIASNSVVEMKGNVVTREVLRTADPGLATELAMTELIAWYNAALPEHPYSLAVITEFVFRFLAIHPFQDGNGRMGRALFMLGMLQCPDKKLVAVAPYLAIDRHIELSRTEYYLALRRSSEGQFRQDPKDYQINYFFSFMLSKLEQSLQADIEHNIGKYENFLALSPASQKVLTAFREHPEVRLKTKALEQLTNLPRSTIIYTLGELTKRGFLHRTGRAAGTQYQLLF